MTFMKLGTLYLNLDNVAAVRDLTPGPNVGPGLVRVEFLDGRSTDVTAHAAELLDRLDQSSTAPTNPPM